MRDKNKTYTITADVYWRDGNRERKTVKVRNCMGELHGKIKLNDYLKKKYKEYDHMIVIQIENTTMSIMDFISGFSR